MDMVVVRVGVLEEKEKKEKEEVEKGKDLRLVLDTHTHTQKKKDEGEMFISHNYDVRLPTKLRFSYRFSLMISFFQKL